MRGLGGSKRYVMPAGRYFIGDPCYVQGNVEWDGINDARWPSTDPAECVDLLTVDRGRGPHMMYMGHTAYGDGVFIDDEGNEYPVDSGQIGATPMELVSDDAGVENGQVVEFKHAWSAEWSAGVFNFGDEVRIDTRGENI